MVLSLFLSCGFACCGPELWWVSIVVIVVIVSVWFWLVVIVDLCMVGYMFVCVNSVVYIY